MATFTPKISLEKMGLSETADINVLNTNFDKIDSNIGASVVTSTTRPNQPYQGQVIYETNTKKMRVWTGTWEEVTIEPSDSGWTASGLTFAAGYKTGVNAFQYRKIGPVVYLRGEVAKNSGSIPTTTDDIAVRLPTGHRPAQEMRLSGMGSDHRPTHVRINSAGQISVRNQLEGASQTSVWLVGISFVAA